MKQTLTLALLLSMTMSVHAQFITLRDEDGNVVNGTMITHHGSADEALMEADVLATLNSANATNVNVRRYELNVQAGTFNYFCWGVCYGAVEAGTLPVWQSQQQHSIMMEPGVEVSNHHAYHEPHGIVGSSVYRFVWFNTADQNDTAWVDIEFHSMAVGIEEQASAVRTMTVYPNPSLGNDVEFRIELTGGAQNAALVVYNMVGERVSTTSLRGQEIRTRLATSSLSSGLYFATVERNGVALASRRFVVTH